MAENMVPLKEDLLLDTHALDIVRGLEGVQRADEKIAEGETFGEGDWAVLNDDAELETPGAAGVLNCFPVWAGNEEGRTDVAATGMATVLKGGRFMYRTSKYDKGQSYVAGDKLTVKNGKVPTKAGGSDAVLAVVDKVEGELLLIRVL